jgi:HupE / UreJ protein
VRRLALVLLILLLPARVLAHQSSVSYSSVSVDGAKVDYTLQLSARDLYEALALDSDREASDDEIRKGEARLVEYVTRLVHVFDGAEPCPLAARSLELVHQNDRFAKLHLVATCRAPVRVLVIEYDLFFDLDPAHVGMIQVTHAGDTVRRELTTDASRFEWDLETGAPASTSFVDFIEHGVEHIFTGYDHICFLLGLLLVATLRERPAVAVLKTVTAFTLAHSLTLIAAALGWFELPTRVVESAIAASIVYVAAENIIVPEPRHRWPLAFGFGLVHGMGFASVLRPMLPTTGIVPPLLAFNLGVEIGQLAIVALVLPLLLAGARRNADTYRRVVVLGGSAVIGLFGMVWLVQRVAF